MMKLSIPNLVNYLSLVLVISFLFFHNIYLVIVGIFIALYMVNNNNLWKLFRYKNIKLVKKEIKIDKEIKNTSDNRDLYTENRIITLVEKIEELGYIPSMKNNDEKNAA